MICFSKTPSLLTTIAHVSLFFHKHSFLVEEGRAGFPKMMSVGLHCRLARPGRVAGLADFLTFAKSFGKDVWICTREEVAEFWHENHYPKGAGNFVNTLGKSGNGDHSQHEEEPAKPGELVDVHF
jgi:hypothetical protein